MSPTVDELSYAVLCLGGDLPAEEIPQDVLDRLAEFKMIQVQGCTAPMLTNLGRTIYHKVVDGSDIPEFRPPAAD